MIFRVNGLSKMFVLKQNPISQHPRGNLMLQFFSAGGDCVYQGMTLLFLWPLGVSEGLRTPVVPDLPSFPGQSLVNREDMRYRVCPG